VANNDVYSINVTSCVGGSQGGIGAITFAGNSGTIDSLYNNNISGCSVGILKDDAATINYHGFNYSFNNATNYSGITRANTDSVYSLRYKDLAMGETAIRKNIYHNLNRPRLRGRYAP